MVIAGEIIQKRHFTR